MNADVGSFDRRIIVQRSTPTQDSAGDEVQNWTDAFKRWAARSDKSAGQFFGAQQIVREYDTTFEIRDDSQSRSIAPESYRVVDRDRVYQIVGVTEGKERGDTLILLCSSRPDLRGAKAPVDASQ